MAQRSAYLETVPRFGRILFDRWLEFGQTKEVDVAILLLVVFLGRQSELCEWLIEGPSTRSRRKYFVPWRHQAILASSSARESRLVKSRIGRERGRSTASYERMIPQQALLGVRHYRHDLIERTTSDIGKIACSPWPMEAVTSALIVALRDETMRSVGKQRSRC